MKLSFKKLFLYFSIITVLGPLSIWMALFIIDILVCGTEGCGFEGIGIFLGFIVFGGFLFLGILIHLVSKIPSFRENFNPSLKNFLFISLIVICYPFIFGIIFFVFAMMTSSDLIPLFLAVIFSGFISSFLIAILIVWFNSSSERGIKSIPT